MNTDKRFFAGVDIGSLSTETVIMDDQGRVLSTNMILTGASSIKAAQNSYFQALASLGLRPDEITYCLATGYGRHKAEFAQAKVTEITCHAKGAHIFMPEARTVIDIGGQDSKAIRLDAQGGVVDFVMNDKCAAGTGRFLEVMARTLEVDLDELGPLALKSDTDIKVSSMCTVFAESEVVSLIGEGASVERIAWGLCRAVADRTASLVERVGINEAVVMSGGVALNMGVVRALEKRLKVQLRIPPNPQIIGALGAAYLARGRAAQSES